MSIKTLPLDDALLILEVINIYRNTHIDAYRRIKQHKNDIETIDKMYNSQVGENSDENNILYEVKTDVLKYMEDNSPQNAIVAALNNTFALRDILYCEDNDSQTQQRSRILFRAYNGKDLENNQPEYRYRKTDNFTYTPCVELHRNYDNFELFATISVHNDDINTIMLTKMKKDRDGYLIPVSLPNYQIDFHDGTMDLGYFIKGLYY